ncbi:MAG TPA: acetate--CoA ligase family protein, partial [Alphaproteobacteria bacterium]|nr:acetate--CoA ligase family protein [Alphaproteobacteria bacterium]
QEPSRTIGVIERVVRAHELQALDAAAEAATFEFPATAEKLAKTLREDARAAGAEGRELSPEECKGLIEAFEIASVDGMGDVGMSLRLGVLRDRESGPVILAATGGGKEPIPANTAFAAPPMTHDKAMDMLARCGALDQIKACGGDGPYDIDALTQALAGLGSLAGALGDVIESLDIAPFAAGPKGQGGIAGKAWGVLRTAALPGPETISNEGRER